MEEMMMYSSTVLIEYDLVSPSVYHIKSQDPLDFQRVVKYFQLMKDFNPDRDNISLIEHNDDIFINVDGMKV